MQQLDAPPRAPSVPAVKFATVESPAPTPTHLLAWLPVIWSRIVFPGTASALPSWQWQPFVLLIVLSGTLLYPCVSFPLFEPDEGRYAQIPREMLERGEWIVPTLQGEPYLDKPPLFYWLVMISYSLFGYHDGAARLIPALAMHATILAAYVLGRRIVGERPAFWGAVLLTVSPLFLGVGRLLVLDGLLTLWVTLALLAAYLASESRFRPGWWTVAALACGLGVLTKGPVAPVLVLVPLWLHRWLDQRTPRRSQNAGLGRQTRILANAATIERCETARGDAAAEGISWRAWSCFAAIVLLVNLPWYVAVWVRQPDFVSHFLWQHNVQRFVEPFDHLRPVWFYVPIVLFGLLPALLLAWPMARFFCSTRPGDALRRCRGLGFLLLAGSWCVLFFSLAGSKLPTYILPALVPLSLAVGCFVARTDWHRSRLLPVLVTVCWLVLAASHYILVPMFARERSPMNHPEMMQACCGDPSVPVLCFPRNIDSVAFYVGRSDFRTYRSKQMDGLVQALKAQPRSVILFAHRNSPETLRQYLPQLRIIRRESLGLCEMFIVENAAKPYDPEKNEMNERRGLSPPGQAQRLIKE